MNIQDKINFSNLAIKEVLEKEKTELKEQLLNIDLGTAKISRIPINRRRIYNVKFHTD